jgi:hypothetical protein
MRERRGKSKGELFGAAELGDVIAVSRWCELLEESDPQRFVWLAKDAACGRTDGFLTLMRHHIGNFRSGAEHPKVVFAIGRALKGQIDLTERKIFQVRFKFASRIGPANLAVRFYDSWNAIATQ